MTHTLHLKHVYDGNYSVPMYHWWTDGLLITITESIDLIKWCHDCCYDTPTLLEHVYDGQLTKYTLVQQMVVINNTEYVHYLIEIFMIVDSTHPLWHLKSTEHVNDGQRPSTHCVKQSWILD